jgi:hypothetical protein
MLLNPFDTLFRPQSGSRKRKQAIEQKSRNSSTLDGAVDDLFATPPALTDVQLPNLSVSSLPGLSSSGDKSELVFDSEGNMVIQTVSTSTHTISGEATTTVDSATCGYDFAYRRPKPTKWSVEDTDKFYEALLMYGSDQMLINTSLPNYTPVQIRQKYKAEMRNDPKRFNAALYSKNRKKLDSSKFEQQHGPIANPIFSIPIAESTVATPDCHLDDLLRLEDTNDVQTTSSGLVSSNAEQEVVTPALTGDATLDSLFHI